MADTKYLQKRRQGWYFVMTIPLELRDKYAQTGDGKPASKIVVSLKTRDLTLAQKERWAKVSEYQEVFRRLAGEIPLTKGEINEQAWLVYQDTLASLERDRVTAEPEREGDDPEVAALDIHADIYDEALEAKNFNITTGLDNEEAHSLIAAEVTAIQKRTGASIREGTETYRLLGEAILRAKLAALRGRIDAIHDKPSEPPATFVSGGIDPITLRPLGAPPRPKARANGAGKPFSEVAAEFVAELQRDKDAKLTEQTRGHHEMAFRLFGQFVDDTSLASIDRTLAAKFLNSVARLDPNWGRSPNIKDLTIWQLLERFGSGDNQLSNRTVNRYASSLSSLFIPRAPRADSRGVPFLTWL